MGSLYDIVDKKFGRLKVLRRESNSKNGHSRWLCKCDCGNDSIVLGSNLIRGHTASCGCLNTEAIFKHGNRDNITYQSWKAMKQRCLNKNDPAFKHYGGRGITICPEWIKSFKVFMEDIGERPGKEYSIERVNVNGNYEKSNCIWLLKTKQTSNTRRSKINRI